MSVVRELQAEPGPFFGPDLQALLEEPGQRMEAAERQRVGRLLDADFTDVVVHTSALADAVSRRLRARAFAVGNHVCFSSGAYEPKSPEGRRILAHELAHVV